jgi:hypothetical protein
MGSKNRKHLLIPDTQVKEGVPLQHLEAMGNYIVEKLPDVIVHIGDHWDMPSLSSYDRGRKSYEGRRVIKDIEAGQRAMETLLAPMWALQARQKANKKKVYQPEMHFCIGNHEERILRHVESNPELDGSLSLESLNIAGFGWEVQDFLKPVNIDGVDYCHYFYNPNSGRPYGGGINNKLSKVKSSFTMGHQQGLQIATETTNAGRKIWGCVAGSFYLHDESYKGPQGNDHFRGFVMKHNVNNGDYSPCIVDINYLMDRYL